ALPPTVVENLRQAFDALRGPPSDLKQPFDTLRGPPSDLKQAFDTLRGPPSDLKQAFDTLRGPPSDLKQAFEALRGPPSDLKQPITLMPEGADLHDAPAALAHARAPARPPPAPATTTKTRRRGAPTIHDWPRIIQLDDEFCRSYFANHNRVPGWKEREDALRERLGNKTPHLKTLQQDLPKIALLKERSSRSI